MSAETPEAYHKRIARREKEDLISLLKTAYGRRFLWGLLKDCHILELPFVEGFPDSTAFNCGMMNVGNKLLSKILEVRPEALKEMQQFAKEEAHVRAAVEKAASETEES